MIVPRTIKSRIVVGLAVNISLFLAFQAPRPAAAQVPASVVQVHVVSAELQRFDKPIRLGVGKRTVHYQEALVLKLTVDRMGFDSLPPDIEPFLYIGGQEFRIFDVERHDDRRDLILTFHIRDWEKLPDASPLVLTIEHGGPQRNPERYISPETPRFKRSMIVDTRSKS